MATVYYAHTVPSSPGIGGRPAVRRLGRSDIITRPPRRRPDLLRIVDVAVLALVGLFLSLGYATGQQAHGLTGVPGLQRPGPISSVSHVLATPVPLVPPQPELVPPPSA